MVMIYVVELDQLMDHSIVGDLLVLYERVGRCDSRGHGNDRDHDYGHGGGGDDRLMNL